MKIILSRKGFDSSIQGGGSANWIYNKRFYPLPIPEVNSRIKYDDLVFDEELSYLDVMRDLNINQFTECHFDPYISDRMLKTDSPIHEWKKSLGQCDIAQNILKAEKVEEDSLFLFFGWFNFLDIDQGKFVYRKNKNRHSEGFHMIYAYLQVDEIIDINENKEKLPEWIKSHPHYIQRKFLGNSNVIYTAKKNLSFSPFLSGAGLFKFSEDLILTEGKKSRTNWVLPHFFHPDNGVDIKYLSKLDSNGNPKWSKISGSDRVRVKASPRGQEFVVLKDKDELVESWAKDLFDKFEIEKKTIY